MKTIFRTGSDDKPEVVGLVGFSRRAVTDVNGYADGGSFEFMKRKRITQAVLIHLGSTLFIHFMFWLGGYDHYPPRGCDLVAFVSLAYGMPSAWTVPMVLNVIL